MLAARELWRAACLTAALVAVAAALVVAVASPPANPPASQTQPLIDGCQRNITMLLGAATPEWVYVDRAGVLAGRAAGDARAGLQTVAGLVTESRVAGEDLYLTHDYNDFNLDVLPDPAYRNLTGDNATQLHLEWEAPAIPQWAWPAAGDRVVATGAWVWDCGHWGNSAADPSSLSQFVPYDPVETARDLYDDDAIRGEGTELHPLTELATFRADAAGRIGPDAGGGPGVELSRLDVWISSDGGPALQQLECHLLGMPSWVVARAACPRHVDVGGTYTYTLPLRPRPTASSLAFVDPVVARPESTVAPISAVSAVADEAAGTVTVSFTLPPTDGLARFGISVEAGWTDAAPAVLHQVRLESIEIHASLDGASEPHINPGRNFPGEQTSGPGEWVLYAGVAGHWVQIPGIEQAVNGVVGLGITLDFWLPAGVMPRLIVTGHECDVPLIDCTQEKFGAGPEDGVPFTEAGFNDRPGRVFDIYTVGGEMIRGGRLLTPGTAVYSPMVGSPGVGDENFSDHVCGSASCYGLTVTWTTL